MDRQWIKLACGCDVIHGKVANPFRPGENYICSTHGEQEIKRTNRLRG